MTTQMNSVDYHRAELRYAGIKMDKQTGPLSYALGLALSQAEIGILDADALYAHIDRMGLEPRWADSRTDFWVQDPLAGQLLVCCVLTTATIH